jgi:hypothetical protein
MSPVANDHKETRSSPCEYRILARSLVQTFREFPSQFGQFGFHSIDPLQALAIKAPGGGERLQDLNCCLKVFARAIRIKARKAPSRDD